MAVQRENSLFITTRRHGTENLGPSGVEWRWRWQLQQLKSACPRSVLQIKTKYVRKCVGKWART